jgi:hypothetical protein
MWEDAGAFHFENKTGLPIPGPLTFGTIIKYLALVWTSESIPDPDLRYHQRRRVGGRSILGMQTSLFLTPHLWYYHQILCARVNQRAPQPEDALALENNIQLRVGVSNFRIVPSSSPPPPPAPNGPAEPGCISGAPPPPGPSTDRDPGAVGGEGAQAAGRVQY